MDNKMDFYVSKDDKTIKCNIVSLIPGDNELINYIAFTDYTYLDDGSFYLQYAKLIKNDDNYIIEEFEDDAIVAKLVEKLEENLFQFAFTHVEEK